VSPDAHDLSWVIVGGGIHGTHLAVRLIAAGVPRTALRIIDPHPRLLHRWRRCTANTGMTHLRSPAVHNLGVDPLSLLKFAGPARSRRQGLFAAPYERPALSLFNQHCDRVIAEHRLDELTLQASARSIELDCDAVRITLSTGSTIEAERLILALGAGDQPIWPAWAAALRGREGSRVHHVFDPGFVLPMPPPRPRVAVLGGGISAAQVALRVASDPLTRVTMVARSLPEEAQFDSDPGWLGPKYLRSFQRMSSWSRRRASILSARRRGSAPPSVRRALRRAERAGSIEVLLGEVDDARQGPQGIRLLGPGLPRAGLEVDDVILATGFTPERPGGELVDALIRDYELPCAECGYPIVDHHLRWHPRVFVSGPLAELELGPAARNIAGARHACARIAPVSALRPLDRPLDRPQSP